MRFRGIFLTLLPVFLLSAVLMQSCDESSSGSMTDIYDSVSYAIGLDFARGYEEAMTKDSLPLKISEIIAGVRDAGSSEGATRFADTVMQKVMLSFQERMMARMAQPGADSGVAPEPWDTSDPFFDSLSYAIGMQFGSQIREQSERDSIQIDIDLVIAAIEAKTSGKPTALSDSVATDVMNRFQAEIQEVMARRAEAAGAENKAKGDAFLAENKAKEGVVVTESGLQYIVKSPGEGTPPDENDEVTVEYAGRLIDGTEFDASAPGNPVTFPVNGVIAGWTEALQLMKPGAEYTLFIPGDLAYGAMGSPPNIGPNEVLVFDVKLIAVERK